MWNGLPVSRLCVPPLLGRTTTRRCGVCGLCAQPPNPTNLLQVAEAPKVRVQKVQGMDQLEEDMHFKLPSTDDRDIDLSLLTAVLCSSEQVRCTPACVVVVIHPCAPCVTCPLHAQQPTCCMTSCLVAFNCVSGPRCTACTAAVSALELARGRV